MNNPKENPKQNILKCIYSYKILNLIIYRKLQKIRRKVKRIIDLSNKETYIIYLCL